ncbi:MULTISPECIES: type II toxin-antitoxin system RelE/ParE family toxin [unclassified Marinobacterium]|uniref:type II toxin-antitoxin system RelE/ParE family toxin n=1 Tax=unclassified Marinobacterium TaxID=2644139 RepID=UPI001569970A|nr:Toxin RelG [Marinobacterium sp. xm-g-48]NRP26568.1 Toxin RelG [Marinobacterium sp. xm-d-420]NRP53007.1 Toxin RelG [Marinobacterium sp. xm-v-242]NRP56601.1 Toxin RelG [Marinobacterium sp. xm-d-510]NRP77588.1 Toxin RelG [Marinobacterium sp. xm-m-383]NRP82233.1 Toxin RelG [Marinobacterium sp. xm-d-509]NRP94769.1 Toxin RelG [Marinobacterium sp. xm-g-59]NRP96610.1 Toxin RelG [Marinobacterium sp. xm-a-127]NRQ01145.1 Toxin RelG [Marinobacterium sp. xm-d-530]
MTDRRYDIELTKQAQKDIKKLSPKLKEKLKDILRNKIAVDPLSGKALLGDLAGYYSVRLTFQDRIVYRIEDGRCVVIIIRAKTHYGD